MRSGTETLSEDMTGNGADYRGGQRYTRSEGIGNEDRNGSNPIWGWVKTKTYESMNLPYAGGTTIH